MRKVLSQIERGKEIIFQSELINLYSSKVSGRPLTGFNWMRISPPFFVSQRYSEFGYPEHICSSSILER